MNTRNKTMTYQANCQPYAGISYQPMRASAPIASRVENNQSVIEAKNWITSEEAVEYQQKIDAAYSHEFQNLRKETSGLERIRNRKKTSIPL